VELAQLGTQPVGSVSARRVLCHEVLEVAAIVEKLLGAQALDERPDDALIIALLEQFAAQLRR
jgi:hypothetical protein